jgi:hypothetical protein
MSLTNRSFRDNRTGEVVKVIDSFENIAILENKTKIDTRRLMDPNFFTEEIDPRKFLNSNNTYNSIFEELKKLPIDNIPDDTGEIKPKVVMDSRYVPPVEDDSAVIYTSLEDEQRELANKYGATKTHYEDINKQNEAFVKILGEDAPEVAELPKMTTPVIEKEYVQRIEVNRDDNNNVREVSVSSTTPEIDPVTVMFKGIKRSVDFTIDLTLENKIPRIDFIEMMEDSYEKSIIDYLAKEFTEELMRNPEALRKKIADKIRSMVYDKPVTKKPVRKVTAKKPVRKPVAKKSVTKKHDALDWEKEPLLSKDLEMVTKKASSKRNVKNTPKESDSLETI